MIYIKIENNNITKVICSNTQPEGFTRVPDSFIFVNASTDYYNNDWAPKTEQQLLNDGVIFPKRVVYKNVTGEELEITSKDIPEGYSLVKPEQPVESKTLQELNDEVQKQRQHAYANPTSGSDRLFVEAQRMQLMNEEGWELKQALAISRYNEIKNEYPWVE